MSLHLVDLDSNLVAAWREAFASCPEVAIDQANILQVARDCLVSPANSFGYMDGGIDAAYRDFFGPEIEHRVREGISGRPEGHLPIGASLIVRTGHARVRYLIVAPTMVMPERVERDNVYRAMRAVLRVSTNELLRGKAIYCPGLATGVGGVAAKVAANEMAAAYRDWKESR